MWLFQHAKANQWHGLLQQEIDVGVTIDRCFNIL